MHAVLVSVTISDSEASEKQLREDVIPQVQQAPGHVAGFWTRKDNAGVSMGRVRVRGRRQSDG
jgi:hypothetical protein